MFISEDALLIKGELYYGLAKGLCVPMFENSILCASEYLRRAVSTMSILSN